MTAFRRLRLGAVLGASAVVGLAAGCARQSAPPGGPEDRRPPVVVHTEPDTFAVVDTPFRGPVRFVFDERISERVASGTLDDAVLVSPHTGTVRVEHGRQDISVTIAGGFKPNLVYRVTLLPVVSDLFNNQLRAPFDLVFSTGAPLVASAVAGIAWDRTNGRGMDDLTVQAVSADSAVYESQTDSGGIYVFRYLPPGRYAITAFQDQNRNGERDRMEASGTRSLLLNGADTVTTGMSIPVLQQDTTPARITGVQPLDSVTVLLEFDDYLDPSPSSQPAVSITLQEPEEGDTLPAPRPSRVPRVTRVFQAREYTAWREELQDSFATLDSLEAAQRAREARARREREAADTARQQDTTRAPGAPVVPDSSVVAPGDTSRAPAQEEARPPARRLPPPLPGGAAPAAGARRGGVSQPGSGTPTTPTTPDGSPLPDRQMVVRLDTALVPNIGYRVQVQGVTNLNGVPLGGGEAALVLVPPPPDTASAAEDSTAVPDTAAVAGDSTAVPDTSVAPAGPVPPEQATPRDTLRPDTVPPDTVPRDTIPPDTVPPDTIPPDTASLRMRLQPVPRSVAGRRDPSRSLAFLHERRR